MKKAALFLFVSTSMALTGCAGKLSYAKPTAEPQASNQKTISKPRDAVWASAVPELGKRFFVINNIDKDSGLINISYSGDPEKYVDCGRVTSYVKNARGERTYEFPGSRAHQVYEVMHNGSLFYFDRRMSLDGRVNLIFEELNPGETRVTANTRYILTRSFVARQVANNLSESKTETINFNSGERAAYPAPPGSETTECVPTALLERQILEAIN